MLIQIEIEVDNDNIDPFFFAWCDELKDKAIEQGQVNTFKLIGIPNVIDI